MQKYSVKELSAPGRTFRGASKVGPAEAVGLVGRKTSYASPAPGSRFIIVLALAYLSLFAAGCITVVPMQEERSTKTTGERHQFTKNYALGKPQSVNVGEAMVKVQDYWVLTTETAIGVARPERDVRVHAGLIDITLKGGANYRVMGRTVLEGAEYTVVAFEEQPPFFRAVLVKDDGTLHNKVVFNQELPNGRRVLKRGEGVIPMAYSMNISDPSIRVRLLRDVREEVSSGRGYENYEIIYSGINASGINLSYREFSREDMARVPFFQNLTYETNAEFITFKRLRIRILKATSQGISYVVESDGY